MLCLGGASVSMGSEKAQKRFKMKVCLGRLYDLTNPNRPGSACIFLGDCVSDPFGVGAPSGLLNSQFYPLNTRGNKGKSDYRALIASVESSNLANLGLQFTARYTYSSTKDNLSSTFSDSFNNANLGVLDRFNPDLDYGHADFDARHRFVGSFNWAVPLAKRVRVLLVRC